MPKEGNVTDGGKTNKEGLFMSLQSNLSGYRRLMLMSFEENVYGLVIYRMLWWSKYALP